jgi:hypothetical protein
VYKPLVRSDSTAAKLHATQKAREDKIAQTKRKAAKAKANAAVTVRPDDTDEAVRETFRRVKEAHDRLPPSDDGEHCNDQESGQKRKRKGKNNKHMHGQALAQLSVKLSACARLATHDVSHNFVRTYYRAFISMYHF